ncbi:methyltransferase domain-containing protein [Paenibacillus sp. LMG 31456]|uniref:Methyltransferase domain-containing protein n=1 Tax=Paenibacillus foliorum TaxID=2654974 RepID=A0A972GW96_9BACL|nr:class I SAM-dependent methyltransferase [Paenibacillus foliorum]NOU97468.1 methyltransferase domain-containing protein [Paenibacillus foliorum]
MSEKDRIIEYYETFDEWGRLEREPIEFKVNWHFIQEHLPKQGHVLDNGAGPGKYAMRLAQCGYKVSLSDITPKLVKQAQEKAEECGLLERFQGFHVADARDLSCFGDGQFDASLMLGPLYHLQTESARIAAVKELYRVTKQAGMVFVAFMPRIRHVITSLLSPQHWKPNDSADGIAEFMNTGIFDHSDEGRFTGAYYFDIEKIQPFMENHGFEMIKMIGSSNISSLLQREQKDYWKLRGDEEMNKIIDILIKSAENPYVLGVSPHIMYMGRKVS